MFTVHEMGGVSLVSVSHVFDIYRQLKCCCLSECLLSMLEGCLEVIEGIFVTEIEVITPLLDVTTGVTSKAL